MLPMTQFGRGADIRKRCLIPNNMASSSLVAGVRWGWIEVGGGRLRWGWRPFLPPCLPGPGADALPGWADRGVHGQPE